MTGEQVIRSIDEAFRETERPNRERLVVGRSLDAERIALLLSDREWADVTLNELVEHKYGLAFLTPAGLRYFLPAYMRATVSDYPMTDVIAGNILTVLAARSDQDDQSQGQGVADLFMNLSSKQRKAIDLYLVWLSEEHGADFPTGEPGIDEPTLVRRYLQNASIL